MVDQKWGFSSSKVNFFKTSIGVQAVHLEEKIAEYAQ